MVGVGARPWADSQVARVSLVNFHGVQLYDTYVRPAQAVTDYRTAVSGIRPADLRAGRPFDEVQADVRVFLAGRVLVGHAVRHDLAVLGLRHPRHMVRDTGKLEKWHEMMATSMPSLKGLVEKVLGQKIQDGEHDSVVDARACMALYRAERDAFEAQWGRFAGKGNSRRMKGNGSRKGAGSGKNKRK